MERPRLVRLKKAFMVTVRLGRTVGGRSPRRNERRKALERRKTKDEGRKTTRNRESSAADPHGSRMRDARRALSYWSLEEGGDCEKEAKGRVAKKRRRRFACVAVLVAFEARSPSLGLQAAPTGL